MSIANLKGKENVFSKRLKELMSNNSVTQEMLADTLKVKRQTISLYINGSSLPPLEKFLDIANYFDVSTDYLVGIAELPTKDYDEKFINEYLGLNEKSIEYLKALNENKKIHPLSDLEMKLLNSLIPCYFFYEIADYLQTYIESLLTCKRLKIENPELDFEALYIPDFENHSNDDIEKFNEYISNYEKEIEDVQALNIFKAQKAFVEKFENFGKKFVEVFDDSKSINNYMENLTAKWEEYQNRWRFDEETNTIFFKKS